MKYFSEETRRKMSEAAKQRCTPEWRRRNSEMRSTKLDTEKVREMYESGHTQCEIASVLGVSQKAIWRHMKNNGIKTRNSAKRNQRGDQNHMWKGGKIIDEAGYVLIMSPKHPRAAECGGYVFEHILVMEAHVGRHLIYKGAGHPESEIVHHKNLKKQDNDIANLQLTNFVEHMKIHNAIRKGGDALCH